MTDAGRAREIDRHCARYMPYWWPDQKGQVTPRARAEQEEWERRFKDAPLWERFTGLGLPGLLISRVMRHRADGDWTTLDELKALMEARIRWPCFGLKSQTLLREALGEVGSEARQREERLRAAAERKRGEEDAILAKADAIRMERRRLGIQEAARRLRAHRAAEEV